MSPIDKDEETRTLDPVSRPDEPTPMIDGTRWPAATPTEPATHPEGDPTPIVGTTLGEGFEVIRFLGEGGMGQVYVARDLKLGRLCAVKFVRLGSGDRERALRTFEREARATARLRHPNIVTVYQFGQWEGQPFLVLELLTGDTLGGRLTRGPMPPADVISVGIQVARALSHAHAAGLVHRDLKLGNIFVQEDGLVKVLDFGLAVLDPDSDAAPLLADNAPLSEVTARSGTPGYMPPEQWRGESPDARMDVWALGVVLYRLLTLRLPYQVADLIRDDVVPASVCLAAPDAPVELDNVLRQALALEAIDRYQTADAMLEALLDIEKNMTDTGEVTGEPYRFLQAFTEADATWFFGRDREAARLATMIDARPMVAVVGPSGAGKSSLIHAGAVPRLRRARLPWRVLSMTPGPAPMTALHTVMSEAVTGAGDVFGVSATALMESPGLVGQALRSLATGRVLLAVDQFEELYTQASSRRERQAFVAALLSAADDASSPVRVVIAIRGDFVHRLTQDQALADLALANVFALGPPDDAAMLRALNEPAARLGYQLEKGLAEAMVHELRSEAAPLPVLQFAVSRLWENRDQGSRRLARASLDKLGGVAGVLAGHAEQSYAELADAEDSAIGRRLLCHLVTADGTRRQMTRTQLLDQSGDPVRAGRVLQHFISARLLTVLRGRDQGEVAVQLAHESLIDRWERLSGWLADTAADRQLRERVVAAAELWHERGRRPKLLWTAEMLEEALRWRRDAAFFLPEPASTFLTVSEAHSVRRRRIRLALGVVAILALAAVAVGSYIGMRVFERRGEKAISAERAAREAENQANTNAQLAVQGRQQARVSTLIARAESHKIVQERTEALALMRAALSLAEGPTAREAEHEVQRLESEGGLAFVLPAGNPMIDEVGWSPDGSLAATLGGDRVTIWDPGTGGMLHQLTGHTGRLFTMTWAPDSSWLASGALGDPHVRVWNRSTNTTRTLRGPAPRVRGVAASPDGRQLAAAHAETGRVWSTKTWSPLFDLTGHTKRIVPVIYSPDSATIATSAVDGEVRLYDASNGETRLVLEGHTDVAYKMAFSADSGWLATASWDKSVIIWDARDGRLLHRLPHGGRTWAAAFSPDGARLATGCDDMRVRLWDTATGELIAADPAHKSVVFDVRFTPDGRSVVSGSSDRTAIVWNADIGQTERVLAGHDEVVWRARISPDGKRVLTGSEDGDGRVWELDGGSLIRLMATRDGAISELTSDAAGKRFATAYSSGVVRVWGSDGNLLHALRGHDNRAWLGRFSPDGAHLATAGVEPHVVLWDLKSGQEVRRFVHTTSVRNLRFLHRGRLATLERDHALSIWRIADGERLRRVEKLVTSPEYLEISRDRTLLAVVSAIEPPVTIFSDTGERLRELAGHKPRTNRQTFANAGTRLLTVGNDTFARIWDAATGVLEHELPGHGGDLLDAVWSPDDALVATACADGKARIFRSAGGALHHTLIAHRGPVRAVRFMPDGTTLATASLDGTVRFWHVASGSLQRTTSGSTDPIPPLLISPDSTRIALAASDGTVRMLRVPDRAVSTPTLAWTGGRTNLRVCRESLDVVAVNPYPAPDTVWAPDSACR